MDGWMARCRSGSGRGQWRRAWNPGHNLCWRVPFVLEKTILFARSHSAPPYLGRDSEGIKRESNSNYIYIYLYIYGGGREWVRPRASTDGQAAHLCNRSRFARPWLPGNPCTRKAGALRPGDRRLGRGSPGRTLPSGPPGAPSLISGPGPKPPPPTSPPILSAEKYAITWKLL